MRISKSSIVLVAMVIIIMSLLCKDATSDNPKIRVQKYVNESVKRSIAPFID